MFSLPAVWLFKTRKQLGRYQLLMYCFGAYLQSRMLLSLFKTTVTVFSPVFSQALSLNNFSRRMSTVGEMVNLMAVDAQRVMQLVQILNQIWSAPFQICVAIYFLYVTMGVSVMAGLGMLLLLIPLNLLIARLVRKIQVKFH